MMPESLSLEQTLCKKLTQNKDEVRILFLDQTPQQFLWPKQVYQQKCYMMIEQVLLQPPQSV